MSLLLPDTRYKEFEDLLKAQQQDPVLKIALQSSSSNSSCPITWQQPQLCRYRPCSYSYEMVQCTGVCTPGPTTEVVTVPVTPSSLVHDVLVRHHDAPTAGHLGMEKTLSRLKQEAYWVNMARDVEWHCHECKCQQSKLVMPQRVPLTSVPIGRPWQMIAVDTLEVPVSSRNNRYLLVIQDYFTKWADAIPLPDQKAARNTNEIVKLCSVLGLPEIVHSD